MKKYLLFFFILLVFLLSFNFSSSSYQILKMTEQWPSSVCRLNICTNLPLAMNFIIHGLWPTNATKPWPLYCDKSVPLNLALIKSLETRLNIYWPNLLGQDYSFWESEWYKHGTCSLNKFDEYNYFKLSLSIKDRLDILSVLSKAGFPPNATLTYDFNDIANAIKSKIGHVNPELQCKSYKKDVLLTEVRLCLDVDGINYVSCPASMDPFVRLCMNNRFKLLP